MGVKRNVSYHVICDAQFPITGPCFSRCWATDPKMAASAEELEIFAQERGWTFLLDKAYCPRHTPDVGQLVAA